jgi:hypothetical protein
MEKVEVTMIDRITGSAVTVQGDRMLLRLAPVGGSELALGLERDQIPELINHCARSLSESERVRRPGSGAVLNVFWWNSAIERETGQFKLMLTFGLGGTLCFGLSDSMAHALLDTLQQHYAIGKDCFTAEGAAASSSATEAFEPGFR